ncbi:DUF2161 domain-containing phosphodiesterase [Paenibacillus sp. 1001270B_150601_E10]|uniref:DUF2161 domain-containing phosphodiesterase n=1 Tax=Paenibacillus sp. 1001270B_150601_E10 TaxID=2787079 RepID=UPI001E4DC95D|nr:DUF2161 family putative PD-(D/E)XK-type phosphodiesterase [Paenibacillus sp. 1001270B_150601_E10]
MANKDGMTTKKAPKARMETDLYPPIKQYWEERGYEVRGEVKHCDLVAIHPSSPEVPVIIELKASINLTLILQGLERMKSSSYVYIAAEKKREGKQSRKRWRGIEELCRKVGLGLITVTFYTRKKPFVEIHCVPAAETLSEQQDQHALSYAPVSNPNKTRQARLIQEFSGRSGDYNVGGSTKRPLVTAYRERALRVAESLSQGCSRPVQAKNASGVGDAAQILRHNYYGWFKRIERGTYALTEAGTHALEHYADVLNALPTSVQSSDHQPS